MCWLQGCQKALFLRQCLIFGLPALFRRSRNKASNWEVEFKSPLLSIFPSNAYCETVFSHINNICTDGKSKRGVDTVNAIVSVAGTSLIKVVLTASTSSRRFVPMISTNKMFLCCSNIKSWFLILPDFRPWPPYFAWIFMLSWIRAPDFRNFISQPRLVIIRLCGGGEIRMFSFARGGFCRQRQRRFSTAQRYRGSQASKALSFHHSACYAVFTFNTV